jgi:two-component system, response regulator RpfG
MCHHFLDDFRAELYNHTDVLQSIRRNPFVSPTKDRHDDNMAMLKSDITCPAFLALNRNIIDEFMQCTEDCSIEVEACIKSLNQNGGDDDIARLFRVLHSFKGNSQMVGLTPFVEPLHKVEEVVSCLRSKQWNYHPRIGEFLIHTTDRMTEMLTQLVGTGSADGHIARVICEVCTALLANINEGNVAEQFELAIARIGNAPANILPEVKLHKVSLELPNDIMLMQSLSARLDDLSIYRKNRSEQVVKLAAELNKALGTPVNPEQLKAASLMHDIGMGFIPHNIFNREGTLSKEELRKLQEHVITGSQIVMRFGKWEDAAHMILDHHERFDGAGYPNGIAGEKIHPGGHILAVVDTFCAITTERSDRAYKKSLLSAISEINANSDSQFHPTFVMTFNSVVRNIMMDGG